MLWGFAIIFLSLLKKKNKRMGLGLHAIACTVGDLGLISGLERSLGEGNGNPFQYSCVENHMDRGAWQATVHGIIKSWTRLRH